MADSPGEFVDAIQRMFSSVTLRSQLTGNGMEFVKKYNQVAMQPLFDVIAMTTRKRKDQANV